MPESLVSVSCTRAWKLIAAILARSPGSDIVEEVVYLVWDNNGVEEEGMGGVNTMGGGISWVLCAQDISCVYCSIAIFRKLKDLSEDEVGGPVATALFPPSLDNSPVVAINDEVLALA
jgi:hypothetical protein